MKRNPNLKPLYFIEGLWDLQGHEYKPYRKSPFPLAGQMFFTWSMYKDILLAQRSILAKEISAM